MTVDYVIGGTGFLGSVLVKRLVDLGRSVIVGVRMGSSLSRLLDTPVELDYDLSELYRADVVYYCAGILGKKGIPLSEYEEAHIRFPMIVMNRMEKRQIFHYVSSAYVLQPTEPYEMTKLAGEKAVKDSGLEYVVSRPAPLFGEGDMHHYPLFKMINRLGRFTPIIGKGDNRICYIDVKDFVKMMVIPPAQEFVAANNPIAVGEFMNEIAYALGKGKLFIHVPYRDGWFKDVSGVKFLTQDRVYNGIAGGAPIEEMLARAVKYYRSKGVL